MAFRSGTVFVALSLAALTLACSSGGRSETTTDGGHDATRETGHDSARESEADAGPPLLVTPSVSGATSGLVPAFSSNVYDYYVRCAAGTNSLTVSMTASPGAASSLIEPSPASPSLPSQTVSVKVNDGVAIEAVATRGALTTAYWVRCLPSDFPYLTMTAYPDAGAPSPGYYLVGNAFVAQGESGYAMLLDSNGVPIWYRAAAAGLAVSDVDSVVSGTISFIPTSFIAYEPFEIEQESPLRTTSLSPGGGYNSDEHELQALSNGDFLTFSYTLKPGVDLTGLAIPLPADAGTVALGPNSTIQDCTILELAPDGSVVSHWSASDHFNPVLASTYPQTGFGPDAIEADGGYDVFHCEAIDIDGTNGLLVSARGMSSVFYIAWPNGDGRVLWKMGGANSSLDNATYVTVADPFFEQHDGRLHGWSPTCNGGTGQVSVFDDESTTQNPARGVLYDVAVGSDAGCPDGGSTDGAPPPGTARVAWQYPGATSAGGAGSFRISSDGSRLIGWGISATVFTEIDANGNKVLELRFTSSSSEDVSYRAIKVPPTAFDLGVLRSNAGK